MDTDRDWEELARRDPYWAVLTDPANSIDVFDADARARFFASGLSEIDRFHGLLRQHLNAPERFRAVLDFGCGVGRLTTALARCADHVVGVDVAAAMRAIARETANEQGLSNISVLESIDAARDHGPFDWVVTFIVLQHIPPLRGYRLIEALAQAAAPGGWISLHVTAFRDDRLRPGQRFDQKARRAVRALVAPKPATIQMFDYDMSRVLEAMTRVGCHAFWLEHTDHGGHHGFVIHARKAQT